MARRARLPKLPMRLPKRVAAAALLLSLWVPSTAAAIRCSTWTRLAPAEKSRALDRLIQDALAGSRGREYGISRQSVARCLERNAASIAEDFDDACAEGMRANLQALNRVFKSWAWSCVR